MRKLIWGIASLVLAGNLVNAQSTNININDSSEIAGLNSTKRSISIVGTGFIQDNQQNSDDPMRSKTFSKSFPVDRSDKITISNKYGVVVIKTWDKKEIKVDVDIKAYSKDANDVQRLLDDASIEAVKSGDQVTFKTNIGDRNGNYGSSTKNGKTVWRREVRINYTVYMPASNALTVTNQYGNVEMGDFSGALYAKVQYGNFTAGNLSSNNNYLSVQYGKANVQEMNNAVVKQQYGSGLTLGTVGTLDLNAQYAGVHIGAIKGNAIIRQQYGSGLTIGSVGSLDLDAQYANVNIGAINGNAALKQQYNNLSIGSVNKLDLKGQYVTVKIASLKGDGNFKLAYNRLLIDNIGGGCKVFNLDADYVDASLNFISGYQGDFDVKTRYTGFKPGAGVTCRPAVGEGQEKNYSGKIGNGGGCKIAIKADYGSIALN